MFVLRSGKMKFFEIGSKRILYEGGGTSDISSAKTKQISPKSFTNRVRPVV